MITSRRSNQRGMSLIETLVGIAMASFLIAGVATLYGNMKNIVALNEANREANSLRTYVQGLINQPSICSNALRTGSVLGAGVPITWTPLAGAPANVSPVGHIEVNQAVAEPYKAPPGIVISQNGNYSALLKVAGITLREPTAAEGGPSRANITRNGVLYSTYAAKLQIDMQVRSLFQSIFLKRVVDLVVAVDAANSVVFCAQQENIPKPAGFTCSQATLTQPDCPGPADIYCRNIYYISGFDSQGRPGCSCQSSCAFFLGNAGPVGIQGP